MNRIEELYYEAKADQWFKRFAVFCRIALAASFIIAGYVKIVGERFAAGLPSNNPLGHYFDALHITGYYYTFIGIAQIITAILLLIPRTSLLGALMYFPIIVNICVLTYATRFDGTRGVTMMLLANLFLLIWDYDRLKHILPFKQPKADPQVIKTPWADASGSCFLEVASQWQPLLSSVLSIYTRSCRATPKRSAAINVPQVKTPEPAQFSATAFINKVNRWIVVWQLLIRRKIFADLLGSGN